MTIDIELLLAWHPSLFLRRKGLVKCLDCGGVFAAIGGGTWDIHPLFTAKRVRYKLTDEKRCREAAVRNKADIHLFTANKPTAYVIAGVAEYDVDVISHLACCLKGMLDQYFAEFLPLVFGRNTKRAKRKDFFPCAVFALKPSHCVHDAADDFIAEFEHKCQLRDEVRVLSHLMHIVMFIRTRLIDVPKSFAGKFFYCPVVFFCFYAEKGYFYIWR